MEKKLNIMSCEDLAIFNISENHKSFTITPQKTGSRTFCHILDNFDFHTYELCNNTLQHKSNKVTHNHTFRLFPNHEDYKLIMTGRNPYNRVVSKFKKSLESQKYINKNFNLEIDFSEFVYSLYYPYDSNLFVIPKTKNINSFSNFISEDIGDSMMKDLNQFTGYFITFIFYGNDGISNLAMAVVGDKFESIALNILYDFALDEGDVNIESLSSIEDLMAAINEHYENSGENWNFFEYKYVEMSPKKKENSFNVRRYASSFWHRSYVKRNCGICFYIIYVSFIIFTTKIK